MPSILRVPRGFTWSTELLRHYLNFIHFHFPCYEIIIVSCLSQWQLSLNKTQIKIYEDTVFLLFYYGYVEKLLTAVHLNILFTFSPHFLPLFQNFLRPSLLTRK